jgi:DNA-binding GntR family transcriptional regulator
MPKLQPINQPESLAKIAYDALRESILTNKLKRDEIYTEMSLAKDLGISRTPVREALLELSSQGLVTFLPRKGVLVNRYTKQDVEEIFELRKAIELAAVEKVARNFKSHDFGKIEEVFQGQRKAAKKKDYLAYIQADRVFHTTLSEMTKNRRFVAIMENIRDMIHLMGIHALVAENRAEEVIAEHEKVLEAVRKGKPLEAREAMDYHLDQSKQAVAETLLE